MTHRHFEFSTRLRTAAGALLGGGVPRDDLHEFIDGSLRAYDRRTRALLVIVPKRNGTYSVRCYPDMFGTRITGLDALAKYTELTGHDCGPWVRTGRRTLRPAA